MDLVLDNLLSTYSIMRCLMWYAKIWAIICHISMILKDEMLLFAVKTLKEILKVYLEVI